MLMDAYGLPFGLVCVMAEQPFTLVGCVVPVGQFAGRRTCAGLSTGVGVPAASAEPPIPEPGAGLPTKEPVLLVGRPNCTVALFPKAAHVLFVPIWFCAVQVNE